MKTRLLGLVTALSLTACVSTNEGQQSDAFLDNEFEPNVEASPQVSREKKQKETEKVIVQKEAKQDAFLDNEFEPVVDSSTSTNNSQTLQAPLKKVTTDKVVLEKTEKSEKPEPKDAFLDNEFEPNVETTPQVNHVKVSNNASMPKQLSSKNKSRDPFLDNEFEPLLDDENAKELSFSSKETPEPYIDNEFEPAVESYESSLEATSSKPNM